MKNRVGGGSDLDGIIFEGELNPQKVESLTSNICLLVRKANELRDEADSRMLASRQVMNYQKTAGAITGTYTAEEAEQWIAEYEKAMSEVPGSDS